MAIYTKTGDKGTTALFGGKRVSKSDPQIKAYGSVDELNSFIGMVVVKLEDNQDKRLLMEVQQDLHSIMGFLAGLNSPIEVILTKTTLFEQKIDKIESQLPRLHKFIMPGGTEMSSWFHIVRTVCRRAEREVIEFTQKSKNKQELEPKTVTNIIQYLNRLSDLFFDMARWYNKDNEVVT